MHQAVVVSGVVHGRPPRAQWAASGAVAGAGVSWNSAVSVLWAIAVVLDLPPEAAIATASK
jgi:hypothetical protein